VPHQFLKSNIFRILRTRVINIKLIIFFHFIENMKRVSCSFLKHSVFLLSLCVSLD